ncbi:DUF551 domain-containing protein [Klebsiella pneumoniae]|uniref:DUF551 domain-containing protein n=1 Tax=Klebsiella pneumoniae TaxID=573 RepID=UPI003ECE7966
MTSKLTRERLQEIAEDGFLKHGESKELARMALATMDSDPVGWTDEQELRDVEKDGCGYLFKANPITLHADPRRVILLYRHAQPAPVVPEEATPDSIEILASARRRDHAVFQWDEDQRNAAADSWNAFRAAMRQELKKSAGTEATCRSNENAQVLNTIKAPPALDSLPKTGEVQNTDSPVIPDGYVMVPMRLTAENGAKGALSGEFSETKFVNCPECFGDDECETCDGSGRIEITVPVTWTTIKEIWAKGVEHFAAAPQSPGIEPATVPGKWIPVSERVPVDFEAVIAFDGDQVYGEAMYSSDDGFTIDGYEPCDRLNLQNVTHWMPLPSAPQEAK